MNKKKKKKRMKSGYTSLSLKNCIGAWENVMSLSKCIKGFDTYLVDLLAGFEWIMLVTICCCRSTTDQNRFIIMLQDSLATCWPAVYVSCSWKALKNVLYFLSIFLHVVSVIVCGIQLCLLYLKKVKNNWFLW